jgi:hypothetical protein
MSLEDSRRSADSVSAWPGSAQPVRIRPSSVDERAGFDWTDRQAYSPVKRNSDCQGPPEWTTSQ